MTAALRLPMMRSEASSRTPRRAGTELEEGTIASIAKRPPGGLARSRDGGSGPGAEPDRLSQLHRCPRRLHHAGLQHRHGAVHRRSGELLVDGYEKLGRE